MNHASRFRRAAAVVSLVFLTSDLWALTGGSISGIVKDPSAGAIPDAKLTLINSALKTEFKASSDARGFYSFPALAVGTDLMIVATRFAPQKGTGVAVDADAAAAVDVTLAVAGQAQSFTVTEAAANVQTQVETVATHLGEVIAHAQIQSIPLNGRSYVDLLAIQPGVSRVRTLHDSRALSSWDMTHNFVVTYNYNLPFDRLFRHSNLAQGWDLSGTTRFSTGFPVTLFDDSDRSLLGTLGNGVNNELIDTPEILPGPLQLNTNPRNGKSVFNTGILVPEALGQLGDASRRIFHGPGIDNFDVQISKKVVLRESESFDVRVEAFNIFNHAQFCGPASVDGEVNDPKFGSVVSAAAPRLLQGRGEAAFLMDIQQTAATFLLC